jgi:Mlc titration factor MtfA (ptsG expression regulator)
VISPLAAAIVAIAMAVIAWLLLAPVLRAARHRRAAATPLARSRIAALERNVPLRARLPPDLRMRLDGLVMAFVAEKTFVGCNGLAITDEMRVTIAAHACVLVLGRPHDLYPSLQSILVYPTPFWVEEEEEDESGLVTRERHVLAGQAWDASRIILSWEDVLSAGTAHAPGYNVVLHEFAHHLEYEGLGLAGEPGKSRRAFEQWRTDLEREFDRLEEQVESGVEILLDPYAAEDEAEFFAVASEEFFERPLPIRSAHHALYALLKEFYGLDPASWNLT